MTGRSLLLQVAAALLRARAGEWDEAYVRRWVEALGLSDEWARARTLVAE